MTKDGKINLNELRLPEILRVQPQRETCEVSSEAQRLENSLDSEAVPRNENQLDNLP